MDNFLGWSDEQIEDLINRVYGGVVSKTALPMDLYENILERIDGALVEGFGGIGDTIDAMEVFNNFGENIKKFSFAKTFQQVNDMGNFILDGDGNQILFSDFKKKAAEIFDIYNNNWLETEFNTAKSISESARQWVDIQANKDILPLLKYSTVGDGRVRASHRTLDGVIRPVDDPFWLEHYPPNDFNCRCIVEQIEEGDITELEGANIEKINPLFKNNPAVTGEVFSQKDHPYFNGLGAMINQPIKDILPKPKPKPKKGYIFKNNNEAKAAIIDAIEQNSALNVNKVTVSRELSLEQLAARADKINELFSEYNLSNSLVVNSGVDVTFKSGRGYYGVVRFSRIRETKQIKIASINFGDKTDSGTGRLRLSPEVADIKAFRHKSAVNPENAEIATTVHEFTHVMTMSDNFLYKDAIDSDFFAALKEIRKDYHRELREIATKYADDAQKAIEESYKIHLGKYAGTNIDEFMAESFTEYKLHSKPSKYAKIVGELIDKYYKKR